ncbi:TspO/MBR related protein [Mariniflexile fucanivorans]|uniref:TspO/MBR related protein n=1 Tax=Mariniflexile fucanivorans TaxID=264023 RepID=A0A4V2QEE6_9FLAO|nr:TspO/MBR family protein [Mariniflexile fucanivorans]TCL67777.1 TspO/MBR related protein [Mariniflexile fucanivorans]
MKLIKLIIIFLIINFSALGIGSWLMNNGPQSEWYTSLNQAPWTPPGWVFGVAWTTIMILFSIYMAYLYLKMPTNKVKILFSVQFILNVSWNYIFFNQHLVSLGLMVIVALTILIAIFMFSFKNDLKAKTLLILPYFIWLCIATSLNAYILINN